MLKTEFNKGQIGASLVTQIVNSLSACNTGDPGLIPGLGSSPVEGLGYPLQCFGASLVAQIVKNLPVMPKTWLSSLGREG